MCEMWTLLVDKERRIKAFENKCPAKTGPDLAQKKVRLSFKEPIGGWSTPRSEESASQLHLTNDRKPFL